MVLERQVCLYISDSRFSVVHTNINVNDRIHTRPRLLDDLWCKKTGPKTKRKKNDVFGFALESNSKIIEGFKNTADHEIDI